MSYIKVSTVLARLAQHNIVPAADQPKAHTKLVVGHQRMYLLMGNHEQKDGEFLTNCIDATVTPDHDAATPPKRKNGNIATSTKVSNFETLDAALEYIDSLAEALLANADTPLPKRGGRSRGKVVLG